jgi:exodeoxyribonuclease-1
MTHSYLFYDIETTGLNKAFDQILQFAAIRTDAKLNEINRFNLKVKLRPDVIPSPQAIITNRISVAESASGLREYEAIGQIHQLLNEPGTISLGYNTLGFDDEFLRFCFHRNLLAPYTHQYSHGCRRMDLLPMTIVYWLYKREVLKWPDINGKPSLKLEHLGFANQLIADQFHEAMADVEATVELARRFTKEKKTWLYLQGYFEKETDASRVGELPISFQSAAGEHRLGLMIGSEYGPQQNYQVPVLFIGTSVPYPNQTLWLRLDLPSLRETVEQNIDANTWVIRKRYGEPGLLLPPLERYWKHLGTERTDIVAENLNWLQSDADFFQKIISYHRKYRYPFIPNVDPDAALYQIGFFTRADEKLCRKFHTASPDKKPGLIHQFISAEARTLAVRLIGRNYPQFLPPQLAKEFEAYLKRLHPSREEEALVDYKGGHRITPAAALIEIERLRANEELGDVQQRLLSDLQAYIKTQFLQKPPSHRAGQL